MISFSRTGILFSGFPSAEAVIPSAYSKAFLTCASRGVFVSLR